MVVGTAHLGEFGSVAAIAKTKSELITNLPAKSTAVLGTYDDYTPKMADSLDVKKILFGQNQSVRAADVEIHGGFAHFDLVTPNGRTAVSLQVLGEHQIPNALAAAAAAYALGVSNEVIAKLYPSKAFRKASNNVSIASTLLVLLSFPSSNLNSSKDFIFFTFLSFYLD